MKILKFATSPGFGKWKKYYLKDAVAHPAKINQNLLEYLILNYTKEGEIVVDPMAGSGSTGVMCALNGRDCISVELEEKFWKWMEIARENVEKTPQLTPKGKIINICGDSRKLSELLKENEEEISSVLFSPPYKTANEGGGLNKNPPATFRGILKNHSFKLSDNPNNIDNLPFGKADCIVTSPPYANMNHKAFTEEGAKIFLEEHSKKWGSNRARPLVNNPFEYSDNEENIGNLPFFVDCIVTSPPFAETISKNAGGATGVSRVGISSKTAREYSFDEENIGNLSIDIAIFSPPYTSAGTKADENPENYIRRAKERYEQMKQQGINRPETEPGRYSGSWENIGNLPFGVDAIISSPPYSDRSEHRVGYDYQARDIERRYKPYQGFREQYENNPENIGSLKFGDTTFLISTILFSPPYAASKAFSDLQFMDRTSREFSDRIRSGEIKGHFMSEEARRRVFERYEEGEIGNDENIGSLPFQVDTIVTSPPYSESLNEKKNTASNLCREERLRTKGHLPSDFMGGIARDCQLEDGMRYSEDENNIGNLKHGEIDEVVDACLFSPPYHTQKVGGEADENAMAERWDKVAAERNWNTWGKTWTTEGRLRALKSMGSGYSDDKDNIGNIKEFGVDVVLTSPPYANIAQSKQGAIHPHMQGLISKLSGIPVKEFAHDVEKLKEAVKIAQSKIPFSYGDSPENIGNLKSSDEEYDELATSVLTSPPYFDSKSDWDETSRAKKEGEAVSYSDERHAEKKNIGNVHYFDKGKPLSKKHAKANGKETYLQAMQKVYSKCHKILKKDGLMILILKNFIRQKQLVPLTEHTIKLCESCGFTLKERLLFKLPQQSFWRVLGKKQWEAEGREYPKDLSFEHILIFKKA